MELFYPFALCFISRLQCSHFGAGSRDSLVALSKARPLGPQEKRAAPNQALKLLLQILVVLFPGIPRNIHVVSVDDLVPTVLLGERAPTYFGGCRLQVGQTRQKHTNFLTSGRRAKQHPTHFLHIVRADGPPPGNGRKYPRPCKIPSPPT